MKNKIKSVICFIILITLSFLFAFLSRDVHRIDDVIPNHLLIPIWTLVFLIMIFGILTTGYMIKSVKNPSKR